MRGEGKHTGIRDGLLVLSPQRGGVYLYELLLAERGLAEEGVSMEEKDYHGPLIVSSLVKGGMKLPTPGKFEEGPLTGDFYSLNIKRHI